ncbi:MAG: cytochrome b [Cognaticolwellia sp.]
MLTNTPLWKNNQQQYGLLSKLFHWLSALAIIGLFALGYWMVELDYYSEWYQRAPHWHESLGVLLFLLTVLRLLWRSIAGTPKAVASHSKIEKFASKVMIYLLYIGLFGIFITGYFITAADGKAIAVFDWFTIPPLVLAIENQEDLAGTVHYYLAYGLIFFSIIHALAALKHHFIDKDSTLRRMTK